MTQDKRSVKELTELWWYAECTPQQTAGFLWHAMRYIMERRPHELVTIAILNEKAFDIYDAADGAQRAGSIN